MTLQFLMEVLVRPSDRSIVDEGVRGERILATKITADSEVAARREAIHLAHHNRLVVSSFQSIQFKEI